MFAEQNKDTSTHEWIKGELRRRGSSMAQVSREIGVTQGSVSLVSQGLHRSQRIERELANALDLTPEELFPERYPKASKSQT